MGQLDSFEYKVLGQLSPANTTAASIYSPSKIALINEIVICNTTAGAVTFRLFIDNDGTTYDQTTALFYDKSVPANDSYIWSPAGGNGIMLNNAAANIAVRTGTNDALTFTVFGRERV